jgi:twitching motility protein PilT
VGFNKLLCRMVERGASDLHLIAGLPPAFRIHGELVPVEGYEPFKPDGLKDFLFAALTSHQKNLFLNDPASRNELDFGYGLSGVGRFRVNIHLSRGSVVASVRALANRIPGLDELGLPPATTEFTRAKHGLVLVTGPTGSGKSTTLAALVDAINRTRRDHILTIEDPIEYVHNSNKCYVTQREVGSAGDTLSG